MCNICIKIRTHRRLHSACILISGCFYSFPEIVAKVVGYLLLCSYRAAGCKMVGGSVNTASE